MRSFGKCAPPLLKVQFASTSSLIFIRLIMGTSCKMLSCFKLICLFVCPSRTISRVYERVSEEASSHWCPWYSWTGWTSWPRWTSWSGRSSRSPRADGSQRPSRLLWTSRRTGQERSASLFKPILHDSILKASPKITKAAGFSNH